MSTATHTPAPWWIGWNVTRLDIAGDDGKLVAVVQRGDSPADDARAIANAHLLKAAPRMLAALEAAYAHAIFPAASVSDVEREVGEAIRGARPACPHDEVDEEGTCLDCGVMHARRPAR